VGFQIGRINTTGQAFGLNDIRDLRTVGYFSLAAVYNMASETTTWIKRDANNAYAGAYAYIADGVNHFGLTSQYVTISWAANTAQTFTVNVNINCRDVVTGANSTAIFYAYGGRHSFIRCYTYSTKYAIQMLIGNTVRPSDIEFDISCEGTYTDFLYFTDDGSHIALFTDLKIIIPAGNASNSVLNCDSTFTYIKIYGLSFLSSSFAASGLFFANPAYWNIQGDIVVSNTGSTFVVPTQGMVGRFSSPSGVQPYGLQQGAFEGATPGSNMYFAVGSQAGGSGTGAIAHGDNTYAFEYGKQVRGNGRFVLNGDAQEGLVILRVATTSTTAARLTANAGSPGPTNIANLFLYSAGSARMVVIYLMARDETTGDVATFVSSRAMR
jgi:hypothetical protein